MKRESQEQSPATSGKMAKGFFWTGLEFIGRQGVTFVIQIYWRGYWCQMILAWLAC